MSPRFAQQSFAGTSQDHRAQNENRHPVQLRWSGQVSNPRQDPDIKEYGSLVANQDDGDEAFVSLVWSSLVDFFARLIRSYSAAASLETPDLSEIENHSSCLNTKFHFLTFIVDNSLETFFLKKKVLSQKFACIQKKSGMGPIYKSETEVKFFLIFAVFHHHTLPDPLHN